MISQEALAEAVLSLICFRDEHALKLSPRLENIRLFYKNRTNQKIFETTLEYIHKYSNAPGMALEYLLEADLQRGEEGKLLADRIKFLSTRATEIDANFVLEQFDKFLEVTKLQNNFQTALEYLDQGELDQARNAAFKLDTKKEDKSPSIFLNDPKSLSVLDKIETSDYISCGIPLFDRRGIRLDRKTLAFIIAAKGMGKSWWLVEVGKGGIQHHHKVLHITLEMSAEKTYLRYLQSIFALTKKESQTVKIPRFNLDEQGKFLSMDVIESIRKSVYHERDDIRRKLELMYRSHLIIKEFPTGMLSIHNLYLYLEQLKRDFGFEPDVLLIDYADLMQIDRSQLRIDTGRLYVELRAVGIEYNCAVGTATQSNKEGAEAKLVRNTNVAEDWSKIATADLVLTLSKTPQEMLMNLARVYVNNFRDEEDKLLALIAQSYATGQFCIDSVMMNHELSQQINPSQS